MISFATYTVRVHRPAMVDDHGALVPDYSSTTMHPVAGCAVHPGEPVEDTSAREQVSQARSVYAPAGADIQRWDLLELPGEAGRWRVRGVPQPWRSPTGGINHLAVVADHVEELYPA